MRGAAFPLGAAVTLAQLEHDPHPVLARLREREPVSWLPALGGWLVTRRDLAFAVMRDAGTFTVPLLLSAFTLGEPERVLAEMRKDLPTDVFARAEVRGQTRDVGRITQLLEQDDRVHP